MSAKNQLNFVDRILRALPLAEDPVGLDRPLWRDWSKHNGYVDHAVSAANGALGMAARAGISWGYQDPLFDHNWVGARVNGLHRTSYHVIYAGQPVIEQADNWYRMHPEIDRIPRIIDLEVDTGVAAAQFAETTWEMSELVLARDGVRPWLYSRYRLINLWLSPYWTQEMLDSHFYILAQYLWDRTREHPGPPTLPKNVQQKNVILHQCADKKAGFPGECQSAAADYDRWELGTAADMVAWIEDHYGGGEQPPIEPPEEVETGWDVQWEELDQDRVDIHVRRKS